MSFQLPDFTSPPLPEALEATPAEYQPDAVVEAARLAAAEGRCGQRGGSEQQFCQIPFPADAYPGKAAGDPTTGVVLYGGALVDPRAYAPLARTLQGRYGLTTVVPIFNRDLAWDASSCGTGRLALARLQFPEVDQWILAGHSFGAIAASLDLFQALTGESSLEANKVAGMVFMAADARGDLGCGSLDFSASQLPFASLTASRDLRLNKTRWEENRVHLPPDTFFLDIGGGNHGQYGSYNETLHAAVLGQSDGRPEIPRTVQQDLAAAAIASVAARAGWQPHYYSGASPSPPLPHGHVRAPAVDPSSASSVIWTTIVLVVGYFWRGGKHGVQTLGNAVYAGRNQ